MVIKPILFNTKMVRAILDGRKTVTRRVVKQAHLKVLDSPYHKEHPEVPDSVLLKKLCEPPYQPGDTMYVRETWQKSRDGYYFYRADKEAPDDGFGRYMWCPSIHMPKEAARIWLKVTDVRVERLQDITEEDAATDFNFCLEAIKAVGIETLCKSVWNSTIKKSDLGSYGWEANPYVWRIAFERCEKPESGA